MGKKESEHAASRSKTTLRTLNRRRRGIVPRLARLERRGDGGGSGNVGGMEIEAQGQVQMRVGGRGRLGRLGQRRARVVEERGCRRGRRVVVGKRRGGRRAVGVLDVLDVVNVLDGERSIVLDCARARVGWECSSKRVWGFVQREGHRGRRGRRGR